MTALEEANAFLRRLEKGEDGESPRLTKEQQAQREKLDSFIEYFDIGSIPPPFLNDAMALTFDQSFPQGRKFEAEEHKANIAWTWHQFWEHYGPAYCRSLEKEASINRAKGKAGAVKKAGLKWRRFSEAFRDWNLGVEVTDAAIEGFSKQPGIPLEKGREFLRTLRTANIHPSAKTVMEATLENCDIKLAQKDAEACLAIIFGEKRPKRKIS
jgi:hypothetical protein